MRFMIFGQTGQVACELARIAPEAIYLGRDDADLANPDACEAAILLNQPDVVVNAAAWTGVDSAESNADAARVVNAGSPGRMAQVCARRGIPFVHISTDYVFDGTGSKPFAPDDRTGPLGVYGATKLEGENAVRAAHGTHAILRTSWVFSAHGNNFVKTMLRLSEDRDELRVVADQIGGPTPAAAIAGACISIGFSLARDPEKSGTYHFAGAPDASWADFAREIFAQANRAIDVVDIASTEFPTPAARPANSRLDCGTTENAFGLSRPDWREGLRDVLEDLGVRP